MNEDLKIIKLSNDDTFLQWLRFYQLHNVINKYDRQLIDSAIKERLQRLHKQIEYGCCGTNHIYDL